MAIVMMGALFCGCNSKGANQPQTQKGAQEAGTDIDKALALKFLQGIQDGDKNKMYEATNLTADIVNESREKLIHARQNKLTEQQRTEFEHALRLSGQIDFFVAKIRAIFPKSSSFQILQSTPDGSTSGTGHTEHLVKITYLNKNDAMRDKTGKPIREMVVHLQELTRSVNGRSIHGFSFSSSDFDKFADKNFEVKSYF